MRIKMFLLALVAALATTLPVQAGAVLGFGYLTTPAGAGGAQDLTFNPATPTGGPPGSQTNPFVPFAFQKWGVGVKQGTTNGAASGTSAGNPLVLPGNTDVVLQVQMVDGGGGVYVFADDADPNAGPTQSPLKSFHMRINNSNTSALALQHDPSATDNQMVAMGVNNGGISPKPEQNLNLDNQNWDSANPSSPNFVSIGNFLQGTWVPFDGAQNSSLHNYVLGHFVIHTSSTGGLSMLSLVNPNNPGTPAFANGDAVDMSAQVFATIPNLFISVTPVPEPTSMALAGMAVSGLLYRIRRKKKIVSE